MYFGVPVKLGRHGVEDIMEIELDEEEKRLVEISAKSVRENIAFLKTLDLW